MIAAGCLFVGGVLLWLQLPNQSSNYLMLWAVEDLKAETEAISVPIPVDMSSSLKPTIVAVGLILFGGALFVLTLGQLARSYWSPPVNRLGLTKALVLGSVAVIALVALWRPALVQYHKIAMRSLHGQMSHFWKGHQDALVALGYFQQRVFALKNRELTNSSEFMRFADAAHFRDSQWTVEPHVDRVVVTAFREDMKTWEDVVWKFEHEPGRPDKAPARASVPTDPDRPAATAPPSRVPNGDR